MKTVRPERAVAATAVAALLGSTKALACATCLCGDPTLTSMGSEIPFAGRKRISLAYLRRAETVGSAGINQRELKEQRLELGGSYWLSDKWALGARLPFVEKELTDQSLRTLRTRAAGDLSLDARYVLQRDGFGRSTATGLQLSLRLPTASEAQRDGEVLDTDVQPGRGLWLPTVALWHTRTAYPWSLFSSLSYTADVDEGFDGYRFGGAWRLNVQSQYALSYATALQLGANARLSGKDRYDGTDDDNSGGFILMLAPGLIQQLGTDTVLNLSVQIPALTDLNGEQSEDPAWQLGLTHDF
ncbi:hypothetical protein Q4485_12385 [Granulosicoccaceae sp. 1_MG-2023]|nr:hypothetical protein [Granulosicoccaceae sp. 1_MG-2023]